jgi:ABC-type phosphate/phosphonate transport system substrate-binding protein
MFMLFQHIRFVNRFVISLSQTKITRLKIFLSIFLSILWITQLPVLASTDHSRTYKIGVLAYKGIDVAIKTWSPHGPYLSQQLAPLKFEIVPLTYTKDELFQAVVNRQVDFVITNPGQYTELELGGHVSRLATRHMSGPEGLINQFGGTVITRATKADINTYADLEDKKILIPSRDSLGGWQVHLREALVVGLDLRLDSHIIELKNHRKVVMAVIAGEADAGFVRSGLIEEMAEKGELLVDQIKVVDEKKGTGYPYKLSTELYPEWPFAVVTGTSDHLASKVLQTLLNLSENEAAAKAAGIDGWSVPGHYSTVNELFRETGLGPYKPQSPTLISIFKKYQYEILLAVFIFFLLFITTLWTKKTNRLLNIEIIERKQIEREREKLIKQLQKSLAEIKTLSGLLPICSHCKKIRDDKGYWNQIEHYIHEHSDAEFSHGICEECAEKYYPDMGLYDDNET